MRLRTHSSNNERGATLVEMAFVMPVLLLVMITILELGLAFRDVLGASQAAREGTRIAAFAGNDPDADCHVIEGLSSFLVPNLADLQRVEIYRAQATGQPDPSKTNVYTFSTGDPLDCTDWNAVELWPATDRQTTVGTQPLDIIGVRVVLDHTWVSQFPPFSGAFVINETEIARMEPEAFQ